jgi:hypothetical protein
LAEILAAGTVKVVAAMAVACKANLDGEGG